jgi:hypothetical protein
MPQRGGMPNDSKASVIHNGGYGLVAPDAMPPSLRRGCGAVAAMELVNIPLQGVVWFGLTELPVTVPNLIGFGLFAILLIEGSAYWAAKLHQMRHRRRLPGEPAFHVARAVNHCS